MHHTATTDISLIVMSVVDHLCLPIYCVYRLSTPKYIHNCINLKNYNNFNQESLLNNVSNLALDEVLLAHDSDLKVNKFSYLISFLFD